MKVMLIGNFQPGHVGRSLLNGAHELQLDTSTVDTRSSLAAAQWIVRVNWHLRGHRPALLGSFNASAVRTCEEFKPDIMVSTGSAPVTARSLRHIKRLGTTCVNYSTDDPWSASHRSSWFFEALAEYDVVYSPRRSNLQQLRELEGPRIEYLPFGYDPELYHGTQLGADEYERLASDVLFVGGGDKDRFPFIEFVIRENFDLALYGANWHRDARTAKYSRGHATPDTIRKATQAAKVNLCLVRRANRDGHVMRSLEAAAMGACMLVEDTAEHREIFGPDGDAVLYFGTLPEMASKIRWLLEHADVRIRMGQAAMLRITGGRNSYRDRLATMLSIGEQGSGLAA